MAQQKPGLHEVGKTMRKLAMRASIELSARELRKANNIAVTLMRGREMFLAWTPNLTADDIAAFAAHVQTCWSAPAGVAAAAKLNVVIRVSLKRDGGLMTEPVLIAAPASAQGPALVQSAMRALAKCQPYGGLPAAKYDEWRLLDLKFSSGGLSTASPVPSAQRSQQPG